MNTYICIYKQRQINIYNVRQIPYIYHIISSRTMEGERYTDACTILEMKPRLYTYKLKQRAKH